MKKFILFFSKTDYTVYQNCTAYAKNMQLSLGLFVLLTGLLAFISGSFAISNLFIEFDWDTNTTHFNPSGRLLTPIIGLFYAIMIMAIDREIVSAKSKKAVFFRIPLAIIIGGVVAVPIELKLLEGRIEKQLIEEYKMENAAELEKMDSAIFALDKRKAELENQVAYYWERENAWSDTMEAEAVGRIIEGRTQIPGKGEAYREALRSMRRDSVNHVRAQENLYYFKENEYKQEKALIEQKYADRQVTQQFDLLSKYQALAKLEENDDTSAVFYMSWGITLLFMLFEIIPSLIKLMTPPTEYDAILEARRRLNIQLTHALANEGLEELDSDNLKFLFNEMDKKTLKKEKKPMYYINDVIKRLIVD